MLIALEKKEKNISEYLLYMWQLEDLFRANHLDEKRIHEFLIHPLELNENKKAQIWDWYLDLIQKMRKQQLEKSGHLSELNEILAELNYLHQTLITVSRDPKYLEHYASAKAHLELLKSKSNKLHQNEVETALNGLYGLLLLRLKKREISDETEKAMASFSKFIAYLTAVYHKIKRGEISLPGES